MTEQGEGGEVLAAVNLQSSQGLVAPPNSALHFSNRLADIVLDLRAMLRRQTEAVNRLVAHRLLPQWACLTPVSLNTMLDSSWL